MTLEIQQLQRDAAAGFALLDLEASELRQRDLKTVVTQTATGTGNINATFGLDQRYRLVFVRCHFGGTVGTAPLSIAVDSDSGAVHDTTLFTVSLAGTNKDVNLRLGGDEASEPAAWTFQSADRVRIQWTNPDSGNITWGLEVGLALAS